jgi:enoyl-CoA hydratase/carnithine racemase
MELAADPAATTFANLIVTREGRVVIVALNRPQALNALSSPLLEEFFTLMPALDKDDETAVIVVTGSGDRAFCAGADVKEMALRQEEGKPPQLYAYDEAIWKVANSIKPTIGALNGLCYGGGALLASTLDIRIGSDKTVFRFVGAARGRINSTWLLPNIVGLGLAKELLLTSRLVSAEEAHRMRLLNQLVAPEQVLPTALEMAQTIAANDQRIVRGAKALLHLAMDSSWRDAHQNEIRAREGDLSPSSTTEAFAEFLESRGKS